MPTGIYKHKPHTEERKEKMRGYIPWNYSKVKKVCLICGLEFLVPSSRINLAKYCSRKCQHLSLKGHPPWNKGKKLGFIPVGAFKKGNTPWNKGLKGLQPWHNISGFKPFKKGEDHPMYGKHPIPWNKNRIKRICQTCKKEFEVSLSRCRKDYAKYCSQKCYGILLKKEMKKKWQNPEYAKRMFKSFHITPNKPETFLTNFLNKILPNEYKYVGDGQFILGGKCPDFLNTNGKKKLIELYGDYWHRNDDPQDRIDYFKKFGFDTLVIWQSELNNKFLKSRILTFNNL